MADTTNTETSGKSGSDQSPDLAAKVAELVKANTPATGRGRRPTTPTDWRISTGILVAGMAVIIAAYFLRKTDLFLSVVLLLVGATTIISAVAATLPTGWAKFLEFARSGLFFMLIGLGLLLFTFLLMEETHTALTFILVVLGVAILLYGTGTQGMGSFNSQSQAATYNVALAGGAGVLAIIVGLGIVQFAPGIRDAFQIQRQYFRVQLVNSDSHSNILDFHVSAARDNVPIPTYRTGKSVEILVPYYARDVGSTVAIDLTFACERVVANVKCPVDLPLALDVNGDNLIQKDGWMDFPQFRQAQPIALVDSDAVISAQTASAIERRDGTENGTLDVALPEGFQ